MHDLMLAMMGDMSEAGIRSRKEDYNKAEEWVANAFSLLPTPVQKVEATKIAIVSGFFCSLGSSRLPKGLLAWVQRGQHHLHQLLREENVKEVLRREENVKKALRKEELGTVDSIFGRTGEHWDFTTSVGTVIKGFLGLTQRSGIEECGRLIAGGCSLEQRLADTSFTEKHVLRAHSKGVLSLAAARDWLLSGTLDSTIHVWKMGTWECIQVLVGHNGGVRSLAVAHDWLVSCSNDKTIRVWNLGTWECVNVLEGHADRVASLAMAQEWLVSGSDDATIRVWDMDTWECICVLEEHYDPVQSLVAAQEWLISGSDDTAIRIWNVGTWECVCVLDGHTMGVRSLVVAREWLVSSSEDGTIRVWSMGAWECIHVFKGHADTAYSSWPQSDDVSSLATRSRCLYSASIADHSIRVWSMDTWQCLRVLEGHKDEVNALLFVHDWLFSGSDDDSIRVWGVVP
ncbi:unnamed protein product [Ostreobium quekettii]|uniref:Uncharacterized protein n=1 Tax=Ostreobium quekettii TaxID=121088 RepID=A0A8S1J2E8_9CHLO|nr:unnamed protein product [Ostreobium quekettii]